MKRPGLRSLLYPVAATLFALVGCRAEKARGDVSKLSWAEVESQAWGQTVTWMMWQGDPFINGS